ncbi:hypothetical protein F0562_006199 [Nyssa sinensis]|uniref:Pentacotripeptide-repeat region of PRORP domain-containing protein n=1 Tax=Nyssa sinensis TaxID=561372 RepID=A0A5J5AML2_9ASTE|nr:hypothetical protein F0562_006199 [Nyssa sinensis]
MILMLGKNKLIEMAENLFSELKKEGLEPDTGTYTEMIRAYLRVGMIQKALETYDLMKASGCVPDKLTLTILTRNLEKAGEEELTTLVKNECTEYVDSPERFLEEVERKYGCLFSSSIHLRFSVTTVAVTGVKLIPAHTTVGFFRTSIPVWTCKLSSYGSAFPARSRDNWLRFLAKNQAALLFHS